MSQSNTVGAQDSPWRFWPVAAAGAVAAAAFAAGVLLAPALTDDKAIARAPKQKSPAPKKQQQILSSEGAAHSAAGHDSGRQSPESNGADANVVVGNDYIRNRRYSLEGNSCIIVGVGGPSGSGKTSIAVLIKKRMGPLCKVVSLSADSYYKTLPQGADPAKWNFDVPDAIDHDLLAHQLIQLKNGEEVQVPQYDFTTHKRISATTLIQGADVVIVDGIFTLHVEQVRRVCDVTMFTMEDLDVCLARRLRRDIVERGREVESVLHQYQTFVKPGFETFVRPSMQHADFIIPRARDNKIAIDMLARDITAQVQGNELPLASVGPGSSQRDQEGF